MYKLTISDSILQRHKEYFYTKIRPSFLSANYKASIKEQWIYNSLNSDKYDKVQFEKKHKEFIKYVYDNYDVFAIGNLLELRALENAISTDFTCIKRMIEANYQLKQKKEKCKIMYVDFLNKLFGYDNFKINDLLDYIIKSSIQLTKSKKYCKVVFKESIEMLKTFFPNKVNELNTIFEVDYLTRPKFEDKYKKIFDIDITV